MPSDLPLANKRILTFVGEIYEDLELWYPKLRLIEAGATVTVAGEKAEAKYTGKNGYPCVADAAISRMRATDFHGVVVPQLPTSIDAFATSLPSAEFRSTPLPVSCARQPAGKRYAKYCPRLNSIGGRANGGGGTVCSGVVCADLELLSCVETGFVLVDGGPAE